MREASAGYSNLEDNEANRDYGFLRCEFQFLARDST
jgi:hypothetical protein